MSGHRTQPSLSDSAQRSRKPVAQAIATGLSLLVAMAFLHALVTPSTSPLLTPDQQGAALMLRARYTEAATRFQSPEWQAAAFYRAGNFKQSGMVLMGSPSPESRYNQGNALCMQGRYADAIPQYEQALAERPGWQDARINLTIAQQGAARTKREGGEELSKIGADEIVFDKKDKKKGGETEDTGKGDQLSDAELRAMWLRNVQTSPADFLRSKFAYQAAMREQGGAE